MTRPPRGLLATFLAVSLVAVALAAALALPASGLRPARSAASDLDEAPPPIR